MTDAPAVTVIVCTHAPRPDHLRATLASIAAQAQLPNGRHAEVIVLDNASPTPVADLIDLPPASTFRVVREEKLGLVHARVRGFREARGDILVYVDDDNALDDRYLRVVVEAFDAEAALGAVGGRSLPCYESDPPPWFHELGISLACRDLGDEPLMADWTAGNRVYPECAPVGAGMAVRRGAISNWISAVSEDEGRCRLGRRGSDLTSGEDNDIVLTILGDGWRVAYLPQLALVHLIPAHRLAPDYLERYAENSICSWVQVLDVHGIRPWSSISAATLPLRKMKSYLVNRAWRSTVHRIRWKSACGLNEGRSRLSRVPPGSDHADACRSRSQ